MTVDDPLALVDSLVARTAVRVARLRSADVLVQGALGGTVLALVVGTVGWWIFDREPFLLLFVAPLLGAALAFLLRRPRVGLAEAAGTLDRAAGAEEAFLTATSADSASREWRVLVAETAVARFGAGPLRRLLPFEAPRGLAPLLGTSALLLAIVLVPRIAEEAPVEPLSGAATSGSRAGGSGGDPLGGATPAERMAAAAQQVRERGAPSDAVSTREDLPAVGDDELRELATALAASGDPEAAAALAALEAGDREQAIDRLRRALGADGEAGARTGNGGGASSVASGANTDHARPPRDATWALRYDRQVRDWFRHRDDPTRTRGAR